MGRKLSTEIEKKIQELCNRYPDSERAAAVLPGLFLAQQECGVIDDKVVGDVAAALGMPPVKVREVATWYTMIHKQPVGRHHVEVCTNLSCHLRGGDELLTCVCKELGIKPGETTADGRFTVSEVECLGSCGTAPALQIDGVFHENQKPESVAALLKAEN